MRSFINVASIMFTKHTHTHAAAFGCIALAASTKFFHDDEKAYSSMIIGGTAVTFVFLACSLGLLQFVEDESLLRILD